MELKAKPEEMHLCEDFSSHSWNILCNKYQFFFSTVIYQLICLTLTNLKIWLVNARGSIISWENKKQVEKTLIKLKKKSIYDVNIQLQSYGLHLL